MSITNSVKVPVHQDYSDTIKAVEQVRDCVEGSPRIKKLGTKYLPHPSQVDKTSSEALARYYDYLLNAEFDGDTDDTRRELIGKMRLSDALTELPNKIDYLERNADGDGTSLIGSIECALNNILQVKFQFIIADYQGLSGVDLDSVSIAEAKELNPRATIKQYSRENVVNWSFSRIDGAMKLSFIMLLERGTLLNKETFTHEEVQSYLILALDEDGAYYQQKFVDGVYGERDYIQVNGDNLDFIPGEFVSDEEIESGKLPRALGFLYNVSEKVLARYRTSAVYKECQKALLPTTYTKGWRNGDAGLFKDLNNRDNIESGPYSVNALPNNVEVSIESTQSDMQDFHWYFEQSKKQVSEMGGKSGAKASSMTATEADIVSSAQNALLATIASNLESCFTRVMSYCAMFEGLVSVEDVFQYEDVVVSLPRDFATPKMSVEEVKVLLELNMSGIRTRDQVVKQLADGGWDIQTAEESIAELENDGGNLDLPPVDV